MASDVFLSSSVLLFRLSFFLLVGLASFVLPLFCFAISSDVSACVLACFSLIRTVWA